MIYTALVYNLPALHTFYDGPIAPGLVRDMAERMRQPPVLNAQLCRVMIHGVTRRRICLKGENILNDVWLSRLSANVRYHRDRAIAELTG